MITEPAIDPETTLGMNVIDGRRKRAGASNPVKLAGLDFPVPGGGTIRLPYPTVRYSPLPRIGEPDGSWKIDVIERIGYAPRLQSLVDKFMASFEELDERGIFAAAVVVAWSMLAQRRADGSEPIDPARLFEMDGDDAIVFVHRMVRLVGGFVDLEQDADGYYLLPVGPSEDQTSDDSPIESNEPCLVT